MRFFLRHCLYFALSLAVCAAATLLAMTIAFLMGWFVTQSHFFTDEAWTAIRVCSSLMGTMAGLWTMIGMSVIDPLEHGWKK